MQGPGDQQRPHGGVHTGQVGAAELVEAPHDIRLLADRERPRRRYPEPRKVWSRRQKSTLLRGHWLLITQANLEEAPSKVYAQNAAHLLITYGI